jgi:hypothetical protein
MPLDNCPFQSVWTGNGYNGSRTVRQDGYGTKPVREGVFKSVFLSFATFAQATLLRERVVRCFLNHQQLVCWDSIAIALRIATRESGVG